MRIPRPEGVASALVRVFLSASKEALLLKALSPAKPFGGGCSLDAAAKRARTSLKTFVTKTEASVRGGVILQSGREGLTGASGFLARLRQDSVLLRTEECFQGVGDYDCNESARGGDGACVDGRLANLKPSVLVRLCLPGRAGRGPHS